MFWIRLEKVNSKKVDSLAKVGGTIVTIGGATIMTFVKGPTINLSWTHTNSNHVYQQHPIKGALIIISGCLAWAAFVILQLQVSIHNIIIYTFLKGSKLLLWRHNLKLGLISQLIILNIYFLILLVKIHNLDIKTLIFEF